MSVILDEVVMMSVMQNVVRDVLFYVQCEYLSMSLVVV